MKMSAQAPRPAPTFKFFDFDEFKANFPSFTGRYSAEFKYIWTNDLKTMKVVISTAKRNINYKVAGGIEIFYFEFKWRRHSIPLGDDECLMYSREDYLEMGITLKDRSITSKCQQRMVVNDAIFFNRDNYREILGFIAELVGDIDEILVREIWDDIQSFKISWHHEYLEYLMDLFKKDALYEIVAEKMKSLEILGASSSDPVA